MNLASQGVRDLAACYSHDPEPVSQPQWKEVTDGHHQLDRAWSPRRRHRQTAHARSDPGGCIITMLLGVAGAFVGGWIGKTLFHVQLGTFFDLRTWLLAILGALVLLGGYRLNIGRPSDPWPPRRSLARYANDESAPPPGTDPIKGQSHPRSGSISPVRCHPADSRPMTAVAL